MNRIRWSDDDRYFGPFTWARNHRNWRPLAIVLGSGDDDEHPHCHLRVSAFGRTLITALPAIIRPWSRRVQFSNIDSATLDRLGRDYYFDTHAREYGFSYDDGFLQVLLGRQTHDSSTEQSWCTHLPWTQWRHVRRSLYDASGDHFWTTDNDVGKWKEARAAEGRCPSVSFNFADFDGQELVAKTRIEEREWHFGTGWFKWLSAFRRPKVRRSLDIEFSGETGQRKGSWKGGTIGTGIEMMPGELHHQSAFQRYCDSHSMRLLKNG